MRTLSAKEVSIEEEELKARIRKGSVPKHIAVIMDGNGRWAQQHGEQRVTGHSSGVPSVRQTLVGATEIGVEYLTLYAFSTENWNRPKEEVNALMDLLVNTLLSEVESLHENGVRLNAIGDLHSLPGTCHDVLQEAIAQTAKNDRITLTLALSYSSRWELTQMARTLAVKAKKDGLDPETIDEQMVAEHLNTHGIPDPELLIRTSGENRISNFLLWQIAYAELYFTEVLWPDFNKTELFKAVIEYQGRERRFGKTSAQVNVAENG